MSESSKHKTILTVVSGGVGLICLVIGWGVNLGMSRSQDAHQSIGIVENKADIATNSADIKQIQLNQQANTIKLDNAIKTIDRMAEQVDTLYQRSNP